MIDPAILDQLHRTGDVRYARATYPVGEVYIVGDASSLKAIVFRNPSAHDPGIETLVRKGMATSIEKAITILDDYFKKKAAGFHQSVTVENKSIHVSINKTDLALDCSSFTAKEIRVYRELLKIRAGSTISYGDLAKRAGIPRGARFVGNAMAKNAFPIIIPCHRVVLADGSMGNYSGGVHIKQFLLEKEGV